MGSQKGCILCFHPVKQQHCGKVELANYYKGGGAEVAALTVTFPNFGRLEFTNLVMFFSHCFSEHSYSEASSVVKQICNKCIPF